MQATSPPKHSLCISLLFTGGLSWGVYDARLMIRLICLTSDMRPWLLVLVLTAHNRGGRSCPRPGHSLWQLTPSSDCLSDTWPWPCLGLDRPQPGRSELPATGALLMTIQYLGINCLSDTWPRHCLGLDRPQPGAVGVARDRGAPYNI